MADIRGVKRGSARRSSWKDERGPSSIRRSIEPFQRQRWGKFGETGWSERIIMGFSERIDTILNWPEPAVNSKHLEPSTEKIMYQHFSG